MAKTAVILFNLGGPDRPESVRPFLFNLFNDPAILSLPQPWRWLLARVIAGRRAKRAGEIYGAIGGASPLLANTVKQAQALETALKGEGEVRVFVAMRYWHPMIAEIAGEVAAYAPSRIVLLPLYPQFSTTTTGSAFQEWRRAAANAGLGDWRGICCYPSEPGWIETITASLRSALPEARSKGKPRILFSAHGLPKKTVAAGDPYQWQVEHTARAVVEHLGEAELDWIVCYQSRVGPLAWIGPAIGEEIDRAGRDRVPLIVVPIAFVSEHSETLVELDIQYRSRAERAGVPLFIRIASVGTAPEFIGGLARSVAAALRREPGLAAGAGRRLCPSSFTRCPLSG
ncbi:MAG: ferrochelatase [Proteobacteria bacterium]|nr:ferrochelatase [Pseudomonadota bacterium]